MSVKVPNAESRDMLAAFVDRSHRTVVPLSPEFVRRPDPDESLPVPPLADLLKGGRGGEVRLKLYLSMNAIAVRAPHDVTRRPSSWARMLSLDDPDRNGARRITDATHWLEAHKLIRTERSPGGPPKVFLLDHAATGKPYTRPKGRYINIPIKMWQNGWIVTLSAPALALWIITKEMQRGKDNEADDGVWVSPAVAKERYGLSDDTRTKGTRELKANGLMRIGRQKQGEDWEWDRLRNTYRLIISRLDDRAGS